MSKILKKFTEGNRQNLQFNFIIFFCFDVIKFLKPVFHAWSPAHFVDNNQNSEKCVFLIIAQVTRNAYSSNIAFSGTASVSGGYIMYILTQRLASKYKFEHSYKI